MKAIFERVSVRRFEDKAVEPEKIEKILRAGMAGPSGGNQRPWEFYVVRDRNTIDALAGASPYAGCVRNANTVIVPCFRTSGLIYPELTDMDMSACVENMLIEITALGLGGVWLSIAPYEDRMRKTDEILGLNDDLRSFALIPVGYPATTPVPHDRYEESRVHEI